MTILIDLDGVVCTEEQTFERSLAKPLPGCREAMAALAAAGHTLVIFSSRSWSELRMTKQWLEDHQIVYHGIHLGKPVADKVIDDRAIQFSGWNDVLRQLGVAQTNCGGGPVDDTEGSRREGGDS
jgi:hydroxymethylpyrimidine pyrophosphatase-like HAD family hydrolase